MRLYPRVLNASNSNTHTDSGMKETNQFSLTLSYMRLPRNAELYQK